MTSKANEKMVSDFKALGGRGGAVFLGVQGGRTSEGVDFPGNQMNSVISSGRTLCGADSKSESQIDYYEKMFFPDLEENMVICCQL